MVIFIVGFHTPQLLYQIVDHVLGCLGCKEESNSGGNSSESMVNINGDEQDS
jgi:hypothetical protein